MKVAVGAEAGDEEVGLDLWWGGWRRLGEASISPGGMVFGGSGRDDRA